MLTRYYRIALLLSLVIAVAGCTAQLPTFGLDAISVDKETSIEGDRDVLVIKDKLTIPKSPVLTDQSVQLSFILENKDVAKRAAGVIIDLFDAPLMKFKSATGTLCNQQNGATPCVPNERFTDILPGEQKQITFDLFSPSHSQIGGLKTDLKLNFKVTYNFEGSTSFTVPLVNVEEIKARQRAGDKIKVDVKKSIGSGPIQVDPELFGSPFILAGQSGTFFFVVKNKGNGNLPASKVPEKSLCIYFPKDLFGSGTKLVTPDGKECIFEGGVLRCDGEAECEPGQTTACAIAKQISELVGDKPLITGYAVEGGGTGGGGGGSGTSAAGSESTASCDCEAFQPDSISGQCSAGCGANAYKLCSIYEREKCMEGLTTEPSPQPSEPLKPLEPLFRCVSVASVPDGVKCHNANAKELQSMILCYNSREVELFKDESRVSMRFSLHKTAQISEPFRSVTILAKIKYPYELRNSFEITVIPAKE